jgi:hypothetical protein
MSTTSTKTETPEPWTVQCVDFGSSEGEALDLDAVEFCRLLSGRGRGEGLLAVEVGY